MSVRIRQGSGPDATLRFARMENFDFTVQFFLFFWYCFAYCMTRESVLVLTDFNYYEEQVGTA